MADRAHNYDYPVDTNSETAAAKVIRFVAPSDARIDRQAPARLSITA